MNRKIITINLACINWRYYITDIISQLSYFSVQLYSIEKSISVCVQYNTNMKCNDNIDKIWKIFLQLYNNITRWISEKLSSIHEMEHVTMTSHIVLKCEVQTLTSHIVSRLALSPNFPTPTSQMIGHSIYRCASNYIFIFAFRIASVFVWSTIHARQ